MIDALTAEDADVRFVGGCVRDALLEQESNDIDIGTPDPPERVLALLKDAGIETRTVPRGIEHGTVTALAGGERYEITTLRRDERTDGRHAEVAFTDDWREDAARRDFTINAMSAAPDGTLYDYFGGQEDLKAGCVRFVGDPATRIAEDHLRILRFFRFHAWYGKGEPDADALTACKDAAHTIPSLPGERMQIEMLKLLSAPNPVPTIISMQEAGVLSVLLPEVRGTERFARRVAIEKRDTEPDPIKRLAAMITVSKDAAAAAQVIAKRWRLASADAARLDAYSRPVTFHFHVPPVEVTHRTAPINPGLDCRGQRRLLYRLGAEFFSEKVLDAWSTEGGNEHEAAWRAMLKYADEWEAPTLPVSGVDVVALDVDEGPEVGRLLKAVEDWWIERDFTPGRAALLEKLDALVAERREK